MRGGLVHQLHVLVTVPLCKHVSRGPQSLVHLLHTLAVVLSCSCKHVGLGVQGHTLQILSVALPCKHGSRGAQGLVHLGDEHLTDDVAAYPRFAFVLRNYLRAGLPTVRARARHAPQL